MKYTVVLAQSVPNELRAELAERLATRFGLTPEQAQKLAARKPGRLLKPTGRARAETLLALYQGLNLKVALEEVAEEGEAQPVAVAAAATAASVPAVTPPSAPLASGAGVVPTPSPWDESALSAVATPAPATASAPTALSAPVAAPEKPATAATASVVTPSATPTVERTFADEAPQSVAPTARRTSLRQQLLVTTVLPMALSGVAFLGATLTTLPNAQEQVIREGARSLAASVGASIDVRNEDRIIPQLKTIVRQSDVGFIALKDRNGINHFASKNPDADEALGGRVEAWLAGNAGASTFQDTDVPADRYRAKLEELKAAGLDTTPGAKDLEAKVADPQNARGVTTNYQIQNIGIFQEDGVRVARDLTAAGGERPLFTVAVGVITDRSAALTRQAILIQVTITVLILLVAAGFAIQTASRIVQPIEALVKAADKISLGQLDTPVALERNDEIGDLSRALERMRLSLEAAMERLRKRRSRGN